MLWSVITFEITVEKTENGKVIPEKCKVHLFCSCDIFIAPEENDEALYELEALTVNGEDYTEAVKKNKLRLKFISSDKTISASFKEKSPAAVLASAPVFV